MEAFGLNETHSRTYPQRVMRWAGQPRRAARARMLITIIADHPYRAHESGRAHGYRGRIKPSTPASSSWLAHLSGEVSISYRCGAVSVTPGALPVPKHPCDRIARLNRVASAPVCRLGEEPRREEPAPQDRHTIHRFIQSSVSGGLGE